MKINRLEVRFSDPGGGGGGGGGGRGGGRAGGGGGGGVGAILTDVIYTRLALHISLTINSLVPVSEQNLNMTLIHYEILVIAIFQ